MSIATALQALRDRQASIIEAINEKGVTLPSGSSLAACASAIGQIQTGGEDDDLDFIDFKFTFEEDNNIARPQVFAKHRNSSSLLLNDKGQHIRFSYDENSVMHDDNVYGIYTVLTPSGQPSDNPLKILEVSASHAVPYISFSYTYTDVADDATFKLTFNGNIEHEKKFVTNAYNVQEGGLFNNSWFVIKDPSDYEEENPKAFKIFETDAVFDFQNGNFKIADIYTEKWGWSVLEEIRLPNLKLTYAAYRDSYDSSQSGVVNFIEGGYEYCMLKKIVIPNLDIKRPDGYPDGKRILNYNNSFGEMPLLQEVVVTNVRLDLIEEIQGCLNYHSAGGSSDWVLRNGSLIPNDL